MSILLHRAGLMKPVAAAYVPASMVFNGTNEVLLRTLATSSPGTTIFTYSLWLKITAFDADDGCVLFQVVNNPTNTQYISGGIFDSALLEQNAGANAWFAANTISAMNTGTWVHFVFRYDSSQATAANRIRMYLNGVLQTPDGGILPTLNEAHALFSNGFQHQIGAWTDLPLFYNGRFAFMDILDGVSAAPTDFAFDDGGAWTRKPYTGSYGTYGFSLDGSTGVLGADVSGNGQNFTGQNMDNSNLDTADLPPYTN